MDACATGYASSKTASGMIAAAPKQPALMGDIGLIVERAGRAEDATRRLRYRLFGPQPENPNGQVEPGVGEYADSDVSLALRTLGRVLDTLQEVEARLG